MSIVFPGSPKPTIGVEVELQTIDPATLALVSGAPRILQLHLDNDRIKQELLQCCIEVNTCVCEDMAQVEQDLRSRLSQVISAADALGIHLIAAGTHPFSQWYDQEVTPDTRYYDQLMRTQWTARRLLTFGLHIHIGIESAEKAMAVFNAIATYLPYLLALSASSPFWEGLDTGLESARSKVFESLPGGGLPYRMRNWSEFQRMIRTLQKIGTLQTIQEVWGDLRPHSKYGTLEIRVCDAIPNLSETLAVAALVQALVVYLGDLYDRGSFVTMPRYWILQENKWRAARWGMHCRLVTGESGQQQNFRNLMEDLLEALVPTSTELNSWEYLEYIEHMLEHGGSASRQRRTFHETHSLDAVVRSLEQELRESVGLAPRMPIPPVMPAPSAERFRPSFYRRGPVWNDF